MGHFGCMNTSFLDQRPLGHTYSWSIWSASPTDRVDGCEPDDLNDLVYVSVG